MIADREQARDEMLALVQGVATANSLTAIYDDSRTPPPATSAWVRATVQHNTGSRRSLGPRGRHTQSGIVFVQIFSPAGDGLESNDEHTKAMEAAFRGAATPGGVVFHDVYTREIGLSGPWFQSNMTAHFEYDLVGG
ncbi:phage tail terminator-like protein [Candidatus Pacearchaeota archaeon]|jgi:hypothetical protein|nr:phage tail terminator-like protein [Candidatus Pacearchaeota archaeon]